MKENFTAIIAVIDKSGSMSNLTNDTIGGFNNFLKEQKMVPGDAVLTLCTFNTNHHLVYDFKPLSEVDDLTVKTYNPSGGTALLDAVGATIDSVGNKLASLAEDERPSKVIVLVITDGEENSSKEFSKEQIKTKIELQQNTYNWTFVFIGANIDAFSEGTSLGIRGKNSIKYQASHIGTQNLYRSISNSMTNYRSSGNDKEVDFFKSVDGELPVVDSLLPNKDH